MPENELSPAISTNQPIDDMLVGERTPAETEDLLEVGYFYYLGTEVYKLNNKYIFSLNGASFDSLQELLDVWKIDLSTQWKWHSAKWEKKG